VRGRFGIFLSTGFAGMAAAAAALPEVSGSIARPSSNAAISLDVGSRASAPASSASSASASAAPATDLYTLDEPVSATFMRDVRAVARKLRYVLVPARPAPPADGAPDAPAPLAAELRDWDLWGPLLLCLALAVLLSSGAARREQPSLVFATVFVAVWAGAAVVSGNAQLLGGGVSFFQCVCVLGYCLCPLVLAGLVMAVAKVAFAREVVAVVGVVWSMRAALVLMGSLVPEKRRLLALYPVALFYALLGWLVYVAAP